MGQRYAVLISGDIAENGFPEFFFDVVLMRDALINNGFAAANIFVLYGDGADYNAPGFPAGRYRPNPAITDLSATIPNVQAIFSDLATGANGRPQLTSDDLLFVWTFDHGSQVDPGTGVLVSVLCLRDGDMQAADFAAAVNAVPHAYRVFCMQQCRSGGFIGDLSSDQTVILTAARAHEDAHPTDDAAERETINGTTYPHGEFNFYLLAALNGQDLLGNAVNADADNNGFLTLREVFDYIAAQESDPATPQYDDGSRSLGDRLHLAFADLFLRDNLSDTGTEPSLGGGLSVSPDINHFRNELLDPPASLLGAGPLGQDTLFEDIEVGQPNFIYVRVRNRGYSASAAQVDVHWSPPSTLPTPTSWTLIGTIDVPPVAPDATVCAGPLVWDSGAIPGGGHYCFVGVLRTAQDPAPDLTAVQTVDEFYTLIRQNNNVVWKNFDVANMFAGGYARVSFQIQGWPRESVRSDLELDLSGLPAGVVAELRLLKRLVQGATLEGLTRVAATQMYVRLKADAEGRCLIRDMPLQPSDNTECVLTLTLPDPMPDGVYDLFARQIVNGAEMGRITRRIAVGPHPYTANIRSREIHRSDCTWVAAMSGRNKIAYTDTALAVQRGYNGCRFCLPELDAG